MTTPIILDCAPGHDDALAIMLTAAHPAARDQHGRRQPDWSASPEFQRVGCVPANAAHIWSIVAGCRHRPLGHLGRPAGHRRGATVVDLYKRTGRRTNADIAVGLDTARFWDMLVEAIETRSA